jgi:putative acetyltransferase
MPPEPEIVIAVDDPRADDVRGLLERHLSFAHEESPPEDVHALDVDGLADPAVTFYGARQGGVLLGIGALKRIDASHAELKSMHTRVEARHRGVGRAMVEHLLAAAADQRYQRVSLETGSMEAFAPARRLYAKVGFVPCAPFAKYPDSVNSAYMTISLDGARRSELV